jgi:release factor glutamine methyltransferase
MVEDALDVISKNKVRNEDLNCKARNSWSVLDLCCGSGAIGISLAKLGGDVKVTCSDLSADALAMAELNGRSLGAKSVKFVKSDMFEAFRGKLGNKKFDMIISNPPYIRREVIETLEPEVRDHEPMMALDGKEDGLFFYRKIVSASVDYLKPEGWLMFEIGYDQGEVLKEMMKAAGYCEVKVIKDLAGLDRVVVGKLSQEESGNV